jgi:transcription elongation GreA/GreB family factor
MLVTDDERMVIAVLREVGYPASSASGLIRQASGLGSNGASIAGWINEIGALSVRVRELEEAVAAASTVDAPDDASPQGDPSTPTA